MAELEAVQERIEVLKGIIQSTEPFATPEPHLMPFGSMVDLCRSALANNVGRAMAVQDVLQVIAAMGITLKYPNPAGIVHTTLTRLAKKFDSGVAVVVQQQGDPMKFAWNPEIPAPYSKIPFLKEMG